MEPKSLKVDRPEHHRQKQADRGLKSLLAAQSGRAKNGYWQIPPGPTKVRLEHQGSATVLRNQKAKRYKPVGASDRSRLVPIRHQPRPIALETSYLDEEPHHRWMLSTCLAGIAATIVVGGALLGIFGENAAPREAQAAVDRSTVTELGATAKTAAPDDTFVAEAATHHVKPEVKSVEILPERDFENDFSYPEITEDELPYGSDQTAVLDAEIQAVENESENITTITKTPPPEPIDETFRLASGGSLKQELIRRGVSRSAADALVAAIEPILPTAMIKSGTDFELTLDRQIDFYGREVIFPVELAFKPGPKETIVVEADEDGRFSAQIDGLADGAKSQYATINHFHTEGRIGSSLYATAKDSGIPDYIVSEFTRVFSYDVDFQRQLAANDTFDVFFGSPLSGSSSKRKVLHYAELNFDGAKKAYYRYTTEDGQTDYFDEQGRSASRALLKTPISGARLTSGFGMRRHPLLGYSKMHAGVDFGAPSGTPIRAAGSGIISLAGRHGSYGNAVVVKHTDKYKTLYAHMSKFAEGIRAGSKVNQGQIIGYVGTTGRSTGPHLHYEVRVNDHPVNPSIIKATGGRQLAGSDIKSFRNLKLRVQAMMKQAPSSVQVLAQAK
jgi:murein DD-endopeptidase MepM/ murein hydrolase activator NlpD